MIKDEVSFTTRRRFILIQMFYALVIHYDTLNDLQRNEIDKVWSGILKVSRYKVSDPDDISDYQSLMKILERIDEIDLLIKQNCKNLSLQRLSKVVLAILRVGTYELKYCEHKHKVGNIIKDYLNIATAFGHNIETGFINGILDKIYTPYE
jgi:transcription antitermination factor NusB